MFKDDPTSSADLFNRFPLPLIQSNPIPPAPTLSISSIDFLPNFAGYSWVGYGAASLLVITHFPNPTSELETLTGPIFRQVLEVSGDDEVVIKAVAWSPVEPSRGEIAAAANNCTCLFLRDSEREKGSLCWGQTAVLVQSTEVEAVRWTGSGDGIVTGGIEVVLWKNTSNSWEIAWKFNREVPQNLVSTTWSIQGPSAMAAADVNVFHSKGSLSVDNEASRYVLICQTNDNSEYEKAELRHPQALLMIQWRPLTGRLVKNEIRHSARHVLLTCCSDGIVRLWCEVDYGKVKTNGKHISNQKSLRRSYCVACVIEINQMLNGTLCLDVVVVWATEMEGVLAKTCEGADQLLPREEYEANKPGRCEWLIGLGPGTSLTFWAIHCLDDMSPMRLPRVNLWKKKELQDLEVNHFQKTDNLSFERHIFFNKAVISRDLLFGPPSVCSLTQLLPHHSLYWLFLYTQNAKATDRSSSECATDSLLTGYANGFLNIDGHRGEILRVAVHPCSFEVGLAVSLDSTGCLLFWSLSTNSSCSLGLPVLNPRWKLCGKLITSDSHLKYTSLRWAPTVLDKDLFLLMGHDRGIDCFIVKVCQSGEEKIACHNLCTIPFTNCVSLVNSPKDIFTISLPSTCGEVLDSNKFMLLGVLLEGFQAFTWEVTVHSYDLLESCSADNGVPHTGEGRYESTFAGRRYCLLIDLISTQFPGSPLHDQVTSFAVVCPSIMVTLNQKQQGHFTNDACSNYSSYHFVTGSSGGSVKLWRSNSAKPSASHSSWELVGMFFTCQGPINAMSVSQYGQKIATSCTTGSNVSLLQIWDPVALPGAGSFMLEDSLLLDGHISILNWLETGNGQLLLGVCRENKLQVYAQRHYGGQYLSDSRKPLHKHIWYCIAFADTSARIRDFIWGPAATPVVVHSNHFCPFGQWLFVKDENHHTSNCRLACTDDNIRDCNSGINGDMPYVISNDHIYEVKESFLQDSSEKQKLKPRVIKMKKSNQACSLFVATPQFSNGSVTKPVFWSMLEIANKALGCLAVYHPEALMMNIFAGHWKRAYIAVRHLVEYIKFHFASEEGSTKSVLMVPQIPLSNYLEGKSLRSSTDNGFNWNGNASPATEMTGQQSAYNWGLDSSSVSISSSKLSEFNGFVETVDKFGDLAALTSIEKMQILAIIDLLSEISSSCIASAHGNLDEAGWRFWAAVRFRQLYLRRQSGRFATTGELAIDSRLIAWAFHSDCQDMLFDSVLSNESTWQEMRNMGVGFWFTNATQLRTRMEKLARLQYLRNKDPKACALLYIALNKLQVLAGLFKISKDEKDKPLAGFISRNFQDGKNKAAALKNAYVLMGRHQLELAMAFFLLGGDYSSAVSVCAKNLGDEQLALVICRLVEGRGGPLEHHLISKFILPSAMERRDYWLSSLLEWELQNYSHSFLVMLGLKEDSMIDKLTLSSNHAAFFDPSIGQYCLTLVTKNSLKNAVGEQVAATMGRWAILMIVTALRRCGLSLEGLECLSSSPTIIRNIDQRSLTDIANTQMLHELLRPVRNKSSSWLAEDVAHCLEFHARLNFANDYLSNMMREHPSWPGTYLVSRGASSCSKRCEVSAEEFRHKLHAALAEFEQKFYLRPTCLLSKILTWSYCNGLLFIGYDVLHGFTFQELPSKKSNEVDGSTSYPRLPELLLKMTKEISHLLSQFILASCISCSTPKSHSIEKNTSSYETRCFWLGPLHHYVEGLIMSLWNLRATLKIFCASCIDVTEDAFVTLDLFEYCVYLATFWLQRDLKGLILMVQRFVIAEMDDHNNEFDGRNLKKLLSHNAELLVRNSPVDSVGGARGYKWMLDGQGGDMMAYIPEDERWKIIGVCLWHRVSSLMKKHLCSVSVIPEDSCSFSVLLDKLHGNNVKHQVGTVSMILAQFLKTTVEHISAYHTRQLAFFLSQKCKDGLHVGTCAWLEKYSQSHSNAFATHLSEKFLTLDMIEVKDENSALCKLWDICVDTKIISDSLGQEKVNWLQSFSRKHPKRLSDLSKDILNEHKHEQACSEDDKQGDNVGSMVARIHAKNFFGDGHIFIPQWQKETNPKEIMPFQSPKEIYRQNGELFEALCINSIHQRQVALASIRKGILFLLWEDGPLFRDQSNYIWSVADWPQNGWAGSESAAVPTRVSPGVDLGLGGTTFGTGSSNFEEFIDPLATVENISAKALSSHPSLPLFLVGSSNAHIYLWEFGKEKALATYGMLPAANVPSPYAMESISALQFDYYGQRFVSAASDGTICTWLLEVGSRRHICPAESSLCFNRHSSDVTYLTSSGSIIAAAGYSTNGINVVVWDTLAPPASSQASITCHEGGARSLSVFDNDIGSGSVSPLIITGGEGGDIGLHDFRYIATGRTPSKLDGMLWHITKAHLGSVTKIRTIQNTSLFLTGSKDGDVRLWDAKEAKLVYQWPKLHERHTFLQPNSGVFGGVIQAAVTDIQIVSHGFVTCGGDGTVKLVQLRDTFHGN